MRKSAFLPEEPSGCSVVRWSPPFFRYLAGNGGRAQLESTVSYDLRSAVPGG